MASKYKTPSQVELVAIYRLEFYKKQKNWKFCQDVCKKNPPEKASESKTKNKGSARSGNSSKSILNKTYNLDPEVDPSDLNNAFLEPDPAKIPPVTPIDTIATNPLQTSHKTTSEPVFQEQKWPELHQHWLESQKQWQESQLPWPESQQNWPGPENQWPDIAKHWAEENRVWSVPEMPEHGWQNVGQGWGEACFRPDVTLHGSAGGEGWPDPCGEAHNAFDEPVHPEAVLSAADDWLRDSQPWPNIDDPRSASLDSIVSFMRGAAAAPHSSEVDLNFTAASGTELSGSTVACLSARQLAQSVSQHAAALRLLLREARARASREQQRPRSTLSVDHRTPDAYSFSSQELPTRDVDLCLPKDSFVAGSHRSRELGRGRGRLHRERLIGIGMGRPYRL